MKRIILLLAILLVSLGLALGNEKFSKPKRVVISGKVLNFSADKTDINFYVNRLGLSQKQFDSKLDSLGNFSSSIEIYLPTDVWVKCKINFLVLVHPGDSIYIEFNGKYKDRPSILKTVKYGGDAVKINQDAAAFQCMYYSNPLYFNFKAKEKAKKEYDLDRFLIYLDSIKEASRKIYDKFLTDYTPDEETKIWALTYIEEDYYDALAFYPSDHIAANKLNAAEWDVPLEYYNPMKERLPITEPMLISGYSLMGFINRYHYNYVRKNVLLELANMPKPQNGTGLISSETKDSVNIYGIIKYTPDTLLRQMVLTERFRQNLERSDVVLFEKYRTIFDTYILKPYLREPLLELYNQTKSRIENPKLATDAMIKKAESSTINQIIDSILLENKGKVIYLDCWATWCGPCRAEMSNSKKLMKQMAGKNVVFVYLCIDSEEKLWKSLLDEFQLGGQHYFLTKKQSSDFRSIFDVQGIPHYFLFDKNGTIVEKGSHLRPYAVNGKIEKLLNPFKI